MYNPYSLKGKKILVTGASSGIGQSVAIECAKAGANIVITGRNEYRLHQTYEMLSGDGHELIVADLSNFSDISYLVDQSPIIDGLSNNAGIAKSLLIRSYNEDYLSNMMRTNAIGPILLTQLLFKRKKLREHSSIVFTTSLSGVFCISQGEAAYAASKGALSGFAKGAALEMSTKMIRVNCVNPSIIDTNLFHMEGQLITELEKESAGSRFPLKRIGVPTDVAWAHVFLLSDASSWITGINLPIDGGFTLI
jgi:NAD(P)-dependent dehydrogenase (short-subunit alcohol dehydrogenase family)